MRAQLGTCFVVFFCAGAVDAQGLMREQLQDLRSAEEARFQTLEQDCYTRFAVNDCLQEVRASKRLVLDDLRRKEVILSDEERRKKGADQLELIAEKTAKQKLDLENAASPEALKAQAERAKNAAQKAAQPLPAPLSATQAQPSTPLLGTPQPAEDAAKNKLDFDRKLKEAQERKESRDKSRLEKRADKPAQPL